MKYSREDEVFKMVNQITTLNEANEKYLDSQSYGKHNYCKFLNRNKKRKIRKFK